MIRRADWSWIKIKIKYQSRHGKNEFIKPRGDILHKDGKKVGIHRKIEEISCGFKIVKINGWEKDKNPGIESNPLLQWRGDKVE